MDFLLGISSLLGLFICLCVRLLSQYIVIRHFTPIKCTKIQSILAILIFFLSFWFLITTSNWLQIRHTMSLQKFHTGLHSSCCKYQWSMVGWPWLIGKLPVSTCLFPLSKGEGGEKKGSNVNEKVCRWRHPPYYHYGKIRLYLGKTGLIYSQLK